MDDEQAKLGGVALCGAMAFLAGTPPLGLWSQPQLNSPPNSLENGHFGVPGTFRSQGSP